MAFLAAISPSDLVPVRALLLPLPLHPRPRPITLAAGGMLFTWGADYDWAEPADVRAVRDTPAPYASKDAPASSAPVSSVDLAAAAGGGATSPRASLLGRGRGFSSSLDSSTIDTPLTSPSKPGLGSSGAGFSLYGRVTMSSSMSNIVVAGAGVAPPPIKTDNNKVCLCARGRARLCAVMWRGVPPVTGWEGERASAAWLSQRLCNPQPLTNSSVGHKLEGQCGCVSQTLPPAPNHASLPGNTSPPSLSCPDFCFCQGCLGLGDKLGRLLPTRVRGELEHREVAQVGVREVDLVCSKHVCIDVSMCRCM